MLSEHQQVRGANCGGRTKEAAIDSTERTWRGFVEDVALESSQKGRMKCLQPKQVARGIVDGKNSSYKV